MRFVDNTVNMKWFTKAAEDVVEVIEIIVAFLQHCFIAMCDIDLSVGVCHRAGAVEETNGWCDKNNSEHNSSSYVKLQEW